MPSSAIASQPVLGAATSLPHLYLRAQWHNASASPYHQALSNTSIIVSPSPSSPSSIVDPSLNFAFITTYLAHQHLPCRRSTSLCQPHHFTSPPVSPAPPSSLSSCLRLPRISSSGPSVGLSHRPPPPTRLPPTLPPCRSISMSLH